jgi:hypothetical protein
MINRKPGILLIVLWLCFCLMPYHVLAASTADAVEPIITEKACSLTLSYTCEDTAFSGVEVKLYRIAEVSADFQYTLTQPFEDSGLILNDIQTSGEWNVLRSTLEAYILANNLAPEFTSVTNSDGQASFDALKTGMYLAIVSQDVRYQFDSALIPLPGLGADGRWQYQASVNAKGEALPPIEPDEEVELNVLKLWKDDNRKDRPKSVEVEIFCNGTSYKTVILSEENHWAYTWAVKADGSDWRVVERNVPEGYAVTVEKRQATFVLTNTWTPTEPNDPGKFPQTGDTMNILPYVLMMVSAGVLLIILGTVGKKTRL